MAGLFRGSKFFPSPRGGGIHPCPPLPTPLSDTKDHDDIQTGSPPTGAQNAGGVGKISYFRRITRCNSKTVQDRCIVSIKDVVYALSNNYVADDLGMGDT